MLVGQVIERVSGGLMFEMTVASRYSAADRGASQSSYGSAVNRLKSSEDTARARVTQLSCYEPEEREMQFRDRVVVWHWFAFSPSA